MLLGFKTELDLNNEQQTFAAKHAGTARHAWNWGLWLTQNILNHNQANPAEKLKFPSAIDLHKLLVAMVKPENPWYYETSKCSPQYAIGQLREAWDRCFKKIAKPPQFKRKGKVQDAFTLDGTIKILGSNQIQVPKFGVLKTFESLPQVPVKNVTISRQSDKWFISFKIEIDLRPTEKTNLSIGVDLGVKHFATLSDGQVFDVPKGYKRIEAKIAKLQYLNRNKQRNSQGYKDFHKRLVCIID
ncbi:MULTISPECIES: transposase [unclassified Microcoleus]|uniref:RNA-guided endonuclease InsQ/TnpB family protein n=1 Tax=unclassified Microcoleus TaxID=2642155 RepID=UPI002FD199CA